MRYRLTENGRQHRTRAMMALMDAKPGLTKVEAGILLTAMADSPEGASVNANLSGSSYFEAMAGYSNTTQSYVEDEPVADPFEEIIEAPAIIRPDIDIDPVAEPVVAKRAKGKLDFSGLAQVLEDMMGRMIDEDRVVQIAENAARRAVQQSPLVRIEVGMDPPHMEEGIFHHLVPALVAGMQARVNVCMVGPAGSGKTTASDQASRLLRQRFFFTSALDSGYKLTGFIDSASNYRRTAFREAFEHGGTMMFDEKDRSVPGAVMVMQSALANEWMDFPDGQVKRHPDFRAIAGTNTWGRGDADYVTANKQDAAAEDRWAGLLWPYDTRIEAASVNLPPPRNAPAMFIPKAITSEAEVLHVSQRWFDRVQAVRHGAERTKVNLLVSPRATQHGCKLLTHGWTWAMVEEGCIWKGLELSQRQKVDAAAAQWTSAQ